MATVQLPFAFMTAAMTSRFSFGDVWYWYCTCSLQPSLSGAGVFTFIGHGALPLYAVHADATAASPSFASLPATSTSAMVESPSGGVSNVALPFTAMFHPCGAMNAFPIVVVDGVSAASGADNAAVLARNATMTAILRMPLPSTG